MNSQIVLANHNVAEFGLDIVGYASLVKGAPLTLLFFIKVPLLINIDF